MTSVPRAKRIIKIMLTNHSAYRHDQYAAAELVSSLNRIARNQDAATAKSLRRAATRLTVRYCPVVVGVSI